MLGKEVRDDGSKSNSDQDFFALEYFFKILGCA